MLEIINLKIKKNKKINDYNFFIRIFFDLLYNFIYELWIYFVL